MSAKRRIALTVLVVMALSGLVGAAAGCAGASSSAGTSSAGGGGTRAVAGSANGAGLRAAASAPLGTLVPSQGSAAGASRDIANPSAALAHLPAIRSAVIKTASLDLRVAHGHFGKVMNAASGIATGLGGFVSRRSSAGQSVHEGALVLRVPAARFDQARAAIERLGRPTNETVTGQDVTQQFVNLDARLGNLESQQRALRLLMRRAQTVSDTIRVQDVLQGVELQIEEIHGQLIYLRNRTAMSTIAVAVHEAGRKPVPPAHASALWKAGARALNTATAVVTSVIVGAGFVIPIAILVLLAVLIGRLVAPWAAPLAARRRGPAGTPPE